MINRYTVCSNHSAVVFMQYNSLHVLSHLFIYALRPFLRDHFNVETIALSVLIVLQIGMTTVTELSTVQSWSGLHN